jgi:hypothetical protein
MNRFALLVAALAASLLLSACQADIGEDEDSEKVVEAAPVVYAAPKTTDDNAWKEYLTKVIPQHTDGVTERVFNYYLPWATDPAEVDGAYSRMQMDVFGVVSRTVLPGNMLSFSSPNSAMMADLVVESFQGDGVKATALKGSRVLFIGKAEDEARVRASVEALGGEFRFVEAK